MAIDAALGRLGNKSGVCTSSTRPTNPYSGQLIYETDTNRTLVYDNAAWLVVADNQVLSIDSTNSRVGIGTTTPAVELNVVTNGNTVGYDEVARFDITNNADGSDYSRLTVGQVTENKMFVEAADETNTKGDLLIQPYGGNVGIGDTTPSYKLDVTGDINATGDVRVAGNPVGMVLIDRFSGTSVTSASFDNVFSSDFDNYKVILNTRYLTNVLYFRFRAGGTDNSDASYAWNTRGKSAINNSLDWYLDSDTAAGLLYNNYPTSTARAQATFDVLYPHASEYSVILGSSSGYSTGGNIYHNTLGITHYSPSSFDGFTIFTNSASYVVNYTVSVYGYVI